MPLESGFIIDYEPEGSINVARNRCKEILLETATELFNKNGYHATGIDTIIAEADVSRMSLYYHFASKDDLILAVLDRHSQNIQQWVQSVVESDDSPDIRLERLFDEYGKRWNAADFHGCPLVNAVAEYSSLEHSLHQAAIRHKERITALYSMLLSDMDVPFPEKVAKQVVLVVDGGAVRAQVFGDKNAHELAKRTAKAVIAAARHGKTSA